MTKFEDELRSAIENGDSKHAFKAAVLLLEILPELRGMVWQPIETAPKDGGLFLVRLPRIGDLVVRCRFETVHKQWLSDMGTDDGGITKMEYFHAGDLWMPIPTTNLSEKLKKAGLI